MPVSYKNTIKSILAIEAGYAQYQVKLNHLQAQREEEEVSDAENFLSTIDGFQDLCVDVVKHMKAFQKDAASPLSVPDQKFTHFCSFLDKNVRPEGVRRPLKTWLVKLGENADTLAEVMNDADCDVSTPESIYKAVNDKLRVEDTDDEMLAKLANKFFKKAIELGRDGAAINAMLDMVAKKYPDIQDAYFAAQLAAELEDAA